MGLFRRKKKEIRIVMKPNGATKPSYQLKHSHTIEILGPNNKKRQAQEAAVNKAMEQLGVRWEIGHVESFAEIASYGVMSTPALVVDKHVICWDRVLSCDEIKNVILGLDGQSR